MSALLLTNWVRAAEVSKDATSAETQTQRDARLQWFRDAKFGALISFNPSSITGGEIGWSRGGPRPLDVNGHPAGVVEDPKYDNGKWGGSCHKGDKVYLHVAEWPAEGLVFDPLSNKVISARTLIGVPVSFRQSADELAVEVAEKDRENPVTVIELTLDKPVATGLLIGVVHAPKRITAIPQNRRSTF